MQFFESFRDFDEETVDVDLLQLGYFCVRLFVFDDIDDVVSLLCFLLIDLKEGVVFIWYHLQQF